MAKGSCNCGDYKHEYSGEPVAVSQKTSGTAKTWSRKGESGKDVTYDSISPPHNSPIHYSQLSIFPVCDTCGTIMSVRAEAMAGLTIVKTGTLDDAAEVEERGRPGQEIFTRNRPRWCEAFPGCGQKEGQ
ncbi:DUF636 domain protein [Teratosphaeria destructans]|uniref:DUF636 domain protein n=1 Tax=Teratosphaeria destructans TaxID=418781 RepID=A0A9W7VXR6_9PEZI|nr:DUF636 domain protein [Teratosphaeria destructans]